MIKEVKQARAGNKLSRLVRLLLNRNRIQKILGANLVGIALFANTFPPGTSIFAQNQAELTTLPSNEAPVLTTVVKRYPVDGNVRMTQGYKFLHPGIDLDGVTGDPIYPFMNGTVDSTGFEFLLGKTVRVTHPEGYKSVYAHLSKIEVKPGDEITTKSEIGKMGSTGHSTGDHLHFEIYKADVHVNPLGVLPTITQESALKKP